MKRLDLKPTDRLLDVGCGTGTLLEAIVSVSPCIEAVGLDPSPEMLNVARQKLCGRAELREGCAEALPFSERRFDVVVSCSAFHYWRKPALALREISRVLEPGGRLVLTDWCNDYLACRLFDLFLRLTNRAHFRTYGIREWKALLGPAGFTDVAIEPFKINWFWGLMTARARRGSSAK
jgi:ubiquinone/menaquinone biosynthesis C-methylase UbiE